MGIDYKTRFISDNIHGSIPYSSLLEKAVLSNPLFNRLQGIKQNSTAYKTYPSLEYSRFIHSIGAMHISSSILHHSINNANDFHVNEFLNEVAVFIEKTIEDIKEFMSTSDFYSKYEVNHSDKRHYDVYKKKISSLNKKHFLDSYEKYLKNDKVFAGFTTILPNQEQNVIYFILMQAFRLSGLLHDLGHPPFSHAPEYAIQDFYKRHCESGIMGEHSFKTTISGYFSYLGGDENQFHECVTIVFIKYLFNHIFYKSLKTISEEDRIIYCVFVLLESVLTSSILHGTPLKISNIGEIEYPSYGKKQNGSTPNLYKNIFSSLKNSISGEIDADRLDFVLRDGKTSGFSQHSYNLERILNNFVLYKHEGQFTFFPSIRSLNDIEKFFKERLSIYKYIVFHHNVVKTDIILYKVIYHILELLILPKEADIEPFYFDTWSQLWESIAVPNSTNPNDFIQIESFIIAASSWNENWLMTAMLSTIQFIYNKKINAEALSDSQQLKDICEQEEIIYLLLTELLYNRRSLLSFWKRNHNYNLYVTNQSKLFRENSHILIDTVQNNSFIQGILKVGSNVQDEKLMSIAVKIQKIKTYLEEHSKTQFNQTSLTENEESIESQSAFELIKASFEFLDKTEDNLDRKLEVELSNILKRELNNDFLVFIKIFAGRLKPGIQKRSKILSTQELGTTEPEIEDFFRVSSIIKELELTTTHTQQFHVFVAQKNGDELVRPEGLSPKKLEGILGEFSKYILELLIQNFRKDKF